MSLIYTIQNATSLSELLPIARSAKEDISFWGFRYITVEGFNGRAAVGELAERVLLITDCLYKGVL